MMGLSPLSFVFLTPAFSLVREQPMSFLFQILHMRFTWLECSPQSFVLLYRFKVNLTEKGALPSPTHRLHLSPWVQLQTLLESQDSSNKPEGEPCFYNLSHLKFTPKSHIGLSVKASATQLADLCSFPEVLIY